MKLLKLKRDWWAVFTKAWSVRFWSLSAAFQAAQAVLPTLEGIIPDGTFSILSIAFAVLGVYSRLVVQKDVEDGK